MITTFNRCSNAGCTETRAHDSCWCPAHRDYWRLVGGSEASPHEDALLDLLLRFKQHNFVPTVREMALLLDCEEDVVRSEMAALREAGRVGKWLGGFHAGLNRFAVGVGDKAATA